MHNKLPDWLEAILPELKPPHVLSTIEIDGQRILRVTSPDVKQLTSTTSKM